MRIPFVTRALAFLALLTALGGCVAYDAGYGYGPGYGYGYGYGATYVAPSVNVYRAPGWGGYHHHHHHRRYWD